MQQVMSPTAAAKDSCVCLAPFSYVFRDQSKKETRVITTRHYPGLPDDEYAFFEAYCADPDCDCRRVVISVFGRRLGPAYVASVGYGFDRHAELAGPFLDPLIPRSKYSDTLLSLVVNELADPCYVARLESHYYQLKRAASNPRDPAYETIRRIWRDGQRCETSPSENATVTVSSATRKKRRK